MKRYFGSIVKRGNYYHWRFKSIDGSYTSRALKNEVGGKISNYSDAEKIVVKWSSELFSLQQLKTKEETIQKIAEVKSLLKVCHTPLSELEDAFFAHPSAPTISLKHRQTYHYVIKSLVNFTSQIQVITVADVTEDVAQAFLTYYWGKGISPKTYNGVLDILRCVFRLMNEDNNPFAKFKKKLYQPEERLPFTIEQLHKIWNTLISPEYHILYKDEMIVLYKLALYTGARCGDLCLLRWSSVDMCNHIIRFMPHKTSRSSRKIVEIPMGNILHDALLTLDTTTEYVLPNIALRYQHNPSGIYHDTKKLLIAAGLTPTDEGSTRRVRAVSRMGFHGFRHTAASLLISNGVNPLVVRDLLGHTSIEMTAHYTHIGLDVKSQAIQSIPDITVQNQREGKISFMELIPSLQPLQLTALGRWMDENLSRGFKHKVFELFRK